MRNHLLACAVAICPLAGNAGVEYAGVNFSGFATVAVGQAWGDSNMVDSGIDGYEDKLSIEPNTLLGLQASTNFGDYLGLTLQGVIDGGDEWDAELTWGYVSVDATDNWRILAGRQVMPHYMYSDYINVSYSYHWIAVPTQLYNAPFNSFNGVSSLYTFEFEDSSLFTQLIYGQESETSQGKSYDDIWGAKVNYNYDWLTVNVAYFEFDESYTQTRPGRPPSTEMVTVDYDGTLKSFDIGVQVDYGNWLVVTELTSVDMSGVDEQMGTIQPWMLSVGHRFGNFMPHMTYGEDRKLDFRGSDTITPFYIAGVRWDFFDGMALKAEYAREEDDQGSVGHSGQIAFVTTF